MKVLVAEVSVNEDKDSNFEGPEENRPRKESLSKVSKPGRARGRRKSALTPICPVIVFVGYCRDVRCADMA